MITAALLTAYCRTTYQIHPAAGPMDLRLGVFHAGLNRWLHEQNITSWALLTAFNPRSRRQSDAANQLAQQRLQEKVNAAGWSFHPAQSVADDASWPAEEQLLVIDIPTEAALDLARQFGQLAVVAGQLDQAPRLRLLQGTDAIAVLKDVIAGDDPLAITVAAETLTAVLGYFPTPPPRTLPVFVYGTLKRGECRAEAWPHAPQRVQPAWTHGRLFNLGSYPALAEGEDQVQGELWHVAPQQLPRTLAVLDMIEGFSNGGTDDLYQRRIITCWHEDGAQAAYAYLYAKPGQLPPRDRMAADATGTVVWRQG